MKVIFIKKKRAILCAIGICALAVFALLLPEMNIPVFGETPQMPLCAVDTAEKLVCITIDTTFGDDYTEDILKVLREGNAKGTFAVMGSWAELHAEEVKTIAASGCELISHSMHHGRYPDMSAKELLADADEARTLLQKLIGVETYYIRAPYGAYDDETLLALKNAGYTPVKWSIDSRDWEIGEAEMIVKQVVSVLKPGDIIMFQNNSAAAPEAIRQILTALAERGYRAVTLAELIGDGDVKVDARGVLIRANASASNR